VNTFLWFYVTCGGCVSLSVDE